MANNENGTNKTVAIVVPIVVAVLSLLGVVAGTDWFSNLMTPDTPVPPPTATEAVITPLADETPATATPVPLPLEEVFPQVGAGEDFDYLNNPATFTGEIVGEACIHSGVYGLRMVYDIKNSGSGGWGVLWANAPGGTVDFTEYSTLVFWVKGGTGDERFKVTVNDSFQQAKSVDSTDMLVLSRDWQEVRLPLDRFGDVNFGLVTNITFDFSVKSSGGQVCVDDISFE